MVKVIALADCSPVDLMLAFDDARNAIVPNLATCSAADLALCFARASGAVKDARVTCERVLVNVTARRGR